jgi:hypothetical protein
MPKDGQVLPTRALDQRYYTNIQLTYVSRWDYAPQAHSRVLNIDFVIWILAGPYKYCHDISLQDFNIKSFKTRAIPLT